MLNEPLQKQKRNRLKTDRQRLIREQSFHDQWAARIDVANINVDIVMEGSTAPENRFILSRIGDVRGKYLLELGCGAGENSVYFARKGAYCIASDLSPGMVSVARRLAREYHVDTHVQTLDAMAIAFPDKTFDIVYAANLLHHIDIKRSVMEIHRVLKSGGMACIWDPLIHNPLIKIYRKIATEVRTTDEQPLHMNIVKTFRKLFSCVEYDTFWFATLWLFLRFYLIERVDPNKERYWKKILYEETRLRSSYLRLEKIDHFIKKIPFMERFGWNIAIVAKK